MEKSIYGIPFDIDEASGSLFANDGSIAIFNANEQEQLFVLTDMEIKKIEKFLKKYSCTSLLITRRDYEGIISLDDIITSNSLKKLHLEFILPTEVVFCSDKQYFNNLHELKLTGFAPKVFPQLNTCPNLDTLIIDCHNGLDAQWGDMTNIVDLSIVDYKERDLTYLKDLPNLRRLRLTNGKMKTLDGLEFFPKLETLFIASGAPKLTNVDAILRSNSVKNIMFENYKKISNWDFLKTKKDLHCIVLDAADSVDFMKDLPALAFLFCKKVKTKNNKSLLFSTELHQDTMTKDGIQVSYIVPCDQFYQPLDTLKSGN